MLSRVVAAASLLLFAALSLPVSAVEPRGELDLAGFPRIEGRVTLVHGNMNSFVPPVVGDRFTIDLAAADQLTSIPFTTPAEIAGEEGMHYVSLGAGAEGVERLRPTLVKRYSNGAFSRLRLVSQAARGGPSVKLDIVPLPGGGDRSFVQVWIVLESDVTEGVVVIEGKASGEFPNSQR